VSERKAEANVKQALPFFQVRDINASLRFYVDGLGFRMTSQWMLQEFWSEGHHRNLPDGEVGVGVSIYFECADALELYRQFRSRGMDAKRPFVGNGLWNVGIKDLDGYNLSFGSPTDAPEESEYSE
jgi:catechol 2,3-dioxygenase-like lactoylglutathione lyase family enzyme